MQTIVVSDLHLSDGGEYEIFAGESALPALIDSAEPARTRLFVNGDAFDFLTNDDPLELDVARAVARARAMAASRATGAVLGALRRFVVGGGQVTFRLGNHDVELGLSEVQAVFRGALGGLDPNHPAVSFVLGDQPTVLEIGPTRVLLTHGEYADAMNRVSYETSAAGPQLGSHFRYPPGSCLVKSLLNPLKKKYRMRYMDLLKPDFQGAVLTALATHPAAVKVLLSTAPVQIGWMYLRGAGAPLPYDEEGGEAGPIDLAPAIQRARLEPAELDALEEALADGTGLAAFDDADGAWSAACKKLARVGLEGYARLHRRAAAGTDAFFALKPEPSELSEARRLADRFGARIVVEGHTHAARWHEDDGFVYANTGTWIPLMRLPEPGANDFEWGAFLAELRQNPSLEVQHQVLAKLETQFHFVRLDEERRRISLEEQRSDGSHVVSEAPLAVGW